MLTILKDSANEPAPAQHLKDEKSKESKEENKEVSPSKIAAGVEEHVTKLQESIEKFNDTTDETEWEAKYKELLGILAEKNIVNFMGGVDIASHFIQKAIQFKRKLIETHLIELIQPVLNKIDSSNKRVKTKCRELTLSFWKNSIEAKDWLHTHLATYLVAPEQHKLFFGAMTIFQDILQYLEDKKIIDSRIIEEGLGVEIEKIIKIASAELTNKVQNVRKMALEILAKLSNIAANQSDKTAAKKFTYFFFVGLGQLKPQIKDKVLEKLNKDLAEEIKKCVDDKNSPEKGTAEEDKLIYAEPLSNDMKTQLAGVLQYFSETVTTCLYSQNWASRSAGLNKIKEELMFTTLGETGGTGGSTDMVRNVNISAAPISKSTEAWTVVLKHFLEDPVLKIYIDGLELSKEVITLFKKYIPSNEEYIKIIQPIILAVIAKLGDQKPKIREKSIDLLFALLKEELIRPEYLSSKIIEHFESTKGSISANLLNSILKICTECVIQYKVTEGNQKDLSSYMQLLNGSLKHQSPGVRQMAEELYHSLFKIHGETMNQYLVNQKGAIVKKLQGLGAKETMKSTMGKTGGFGVGGKTQNSGIAALRNLLESGSDTLLSSDDPSQRIKGLLGIKKYITKQQATKQITADKAHEILEELSMLMRTVLNDTNPEVYSEALTLLKFALEQLLKYLTPFDLQITVNTIISILIPKTIASPNHKIQIASDKFIISLGKESLVGPIIIIKNVFRLLDKLSSESSMFQKTLRASSSQSQGFGNKTGGTFDLTQNINAVMKYLGVACLVLSHFKTVIAHSKEAIECFSETAVNLFMNYPDKCQIKEAVAQISRDIRAVDSKAFDPIMSKKEGEQKLKLTEVLNAAPGEFEEKQLVAKEGLKKKFGSSKGFNIPKELQEQGTPKNSILPAVHVPGSGKMEEKTPKNLPSLSKRLGKTTESAGSISKGLPPIEKPATLPPLVMKKNQPMEIKPKDTTGGMKAKWLEEAEDKAEKPFILTKDKFNFINNKGEDDGIVRISGEDNEGMTGQQPYKPQGASPFGFNKY